MTATVTSVTVELRTDSDDVAISTPRLSWTTASTTGEWTQVGAEIELDGEHLSAVDGRDSVLVAWPFAPIVPRSRHAVRVRVTGNDGVVSEWSEPREFVAAFLADGEWVAPLVGLASPERVAQPALLRTEFMIAAPLVRATLYATAHGAYQVQINGREVDDQILKPGWTPYPRRLIHESTDVTALIAVGANAIGVQIAGAWYTERYGFRVTSPPFYGEQPAAALQLAIEYADGSTDRIVTGPDWRATGEGPIVASGIYDGESHDARREQDGWAQAGFDDGGWHAVRLDSDPMPVPTARTSPAVRAIEERAVEEELVSASGQRILDFGQNLVGRLRIRVRGEAGTVVTLRHAEVLEHGELGVRPLRLAKATDTYTLRGVDEEVWEPAFTFHGFRYAQVTGLPEPIDGDDVTAVVIHSDMRRTGWFESSHEMLNRLHENVVWGIRGNFLYLPTDCPQRDERLGWTGDIQVFAPTASFVYDTNAFLTSWSVDLAMEQDAAGGGIVPFVIPDVLHDAATPAAAWGDAATVVPTVLHERFGDIGVLETQFDSMRGWADCLLALAGDRMLWEGGFQFGDWLDPTAPPHDAALAKTDPHIVASAYLYRSVDFTARAAAILGRHADAERYAALAERVRAAFLSEYVTETGRMMSDAQTAYALAIVFGLSGSSAQRAGMGQRLAELVSENGYRIGTGFVGTPLIADALTATGHLDVAGRLLTQTENPSWLYPVTMGATTIWERWDSMLEDGSINPGEMTSFNHYALGAVADWLHRTVAGLAPAAPGYRVIRIAPQPLAELDHATASLDTPYGPARVAWRREGDRVVVEAEVPANTTAEVILPGREPIAVGSGAHTWTVDSAPPSGS
ncbi:family 78 glycoside hydrolase catalytic domain [Lacisediminihabitans profunda]|uniref:alpha-L-rhamnosidase n=1 Tax=Lacisediminihabitans profunda TaxID=2594790 RepID=A0A5C8ULY6_9MICO|nr:family 78 glycoside hydrolase catalytic domain [Lacisediminihabitans profunda]TXN29333.1 Bacterial alpha-L-rhamnosidase [Lacisediminihabitans profunda]